MENQNQPNEDQNMLGEIIPVLLKYGEQYFGKETFAKIVSGTFDFKEYKQKMADIERLKIHLDAVKTSSLEQYKNLASISALCAMLLIVATFNDRIFPYSVWVQILLTVLLVTIVLSLWTFFYNFNSAIKNSMKEIIRLQKQYGGEKGAEETEKILKNSKKELITYAPIFVNSLVTLVIIGIIILIWFL